MDGELPPELSALLDGNDPSSRDAAWCTFLERHSRILLKAAGGFGRDYDARMDRYRFIVEALRKDDFRRLRSYRVQGRSSFRSWLAVVARRLCLDYERRRYGRGGRATNVTESEQGRSVRRQLVDLLATDLDVGELPRDPGSDPETRMRQAELGEALKTAVGDLEPRDRLLLTLRFEDGLSVRQITDLMRYPSVFHVYRHLRSILADLREKLVSRGIGDSTP